VFVIVNEDAAEATPTVDCITWVEGVSVCADENPVIKRQSTAINDAFKRPNAENPTKRWLNIYFPSQGRPSAHQGIALRAQRTEADARHGRAHANARPFANLLVKNGPVTVEKNRPYLLTPPARAKAELL